MLGIDPLIKNIEGFPNYQISEDGTVYSKVTGNEIKQHFDNMGYYRTTIYKSADMPKTLKIHRILALTFIPNPNNLPLVDHIDRCKTNNKLENLRWVTHSQNSQNSSIPSNNTSGHKGIHIEYRTTNNINWTYYRTQIKIGNKQVTKNFPFTPEGLEQAIAHRKEQEAIHYI